MSHSNSDVSSDAEGQFSPIARPAITALTDISASSSYSDEDCNNFRFFRKNPRLVLDDTVLSERFGQDDIDIAVGLPEGWKRSH